MTASTAQITRVRRMTGETNSKAYLDNEIGDIIERYPLLDAEGEPPYTWDTTTSPPTADTNEDWIPTYDLHAAAADIWEEKAAVAAGHYDTLLDPKAQDPRYERFMQNARRHRSLRSIKTVRLHSWPNERARTRPPWIVNLPEDD